MSSTKVKAPAFYLGHWHRCLEWLAAQNGGAEIELGSFDTREKVNTAANKARSMRQSVRTYPGWSYNIKALVADGLLTFRTELVGRLWRLYAVRKSRYRSLSAIAAQALSANK